MSNFSVGNFYKKHAPAPAGTNPMSTGFKPMPLAQSFAKAMPGATNFSFGGLLGNMLNNFKGSLNQGFTNWQNKNNPTRSAGAPQIPEGNRPQFEAKDWNPIDIKLPTSGTDINTDMTHLTPNPLINFMRMRGY